MFQSTTRETQSQHARTDYYKNGSTSHILRVSLLDVRAALIIKVDPPYIEVFGYPEGLKSRNIPLMARIVSIIDAYDFMTNGRPYKQPLTGREALQELKHCAGKQFDPELVEVLIKLATVQR